MKENGHEGREANSELETSIVRSREQGRPVDQSAIESLSSRLGTSLRGIRIHTGASEARMNREINARAFTVGRDIYFNQGQYYPGSSEGKRLLAHELVHVAQQMKTSQKIQRKSVFKKNTTKGSTP